MPRSRCGASVEVDSRSFEAVTSTHVNQTRRGLLLELFQAGLDRVAGRRSVARALSAPSGTVWIAAIGKAASAMALGAHDVLGLSIERTLVITKDGHIAPQIHALH